MEGLAEFQGFYKPTRDAIFTLNDAVEDANGNGLSRNPKFFFVSFVFFVVHISL